MRRHTKASSAASTSRGGRFALTSLLALTALMALTVSSSSAAIVHPLKTSFGAFANPSGIAIHAANGNVFVADGGPENAVDILGSAGGAPIGVSFPFRIGGFAFENESSGVAVDNSATSPSKGALYVTDVKSNSVKKFVLNGSEEYELKEELSPEAPGFVEPLGVAVDSKGNVFVANYGGEGGSPNVAVIEFGPIGTELARFSIEAGPGFPASVHPGGVAIDSAGNLYVEGYGGGSVYRLAANGSGEIEPGTDPSKVVTGGATGIAVDPDTDALYVGLGDHVAQYSSAGVLESEFGTGELTATQRVAVGPSGDVYVVDRGKDKVVVFSPPLSVPIAETEAASEVTATSATLHGTVSADGGPPAGCIFEYVELHAKGFGGATSVPCFPAGPYTGTDSVAVEAKLAGLPEAGYRFRLVASNENGDNPGETLLFNTFQATGLPDGRAYELVSPPQKVGEVFPPEPSANLGSSCDACLPFVPGLTPTQPMQSAPDGESVVFEGQPFSGGFAPGADQYISRRGPSGWATGVLNSSPFFELSNNQGFREFSPGLTRSILYDVRFPLSTQAPSREGRLFANLYLREEGGLPQPLVTEEPPQRSAGDPAEPGADTFQIRYEVANSGTAVSAPLSHVVFSANDALTGAVEDTAPAAPPVGAEEKNLYEWSGGQLRLLNVAPGNGEAIAGAVVGAGNLLALQEPTQEGTNVDHAISADGTRIFWSDSFSGQVYVRIDAKETLKVEDPGSGWFLTAAADGSKVLLSDGCLYDLAAESCEDLTLDQDEVPQGGFQGILGAAEDLSRIYFIDAAALTPASEESANGEHAKAGATNLYLWDQGETSFIGALQGFGAEGDNRFGGIYGNWRASRQNRTAQVSPDGRYLAFMSRAPLTGYDNSLRGGGRCTGSEVPACAEVFHYDAESTRLSCTSCNPSGERPLGPASLSLLRVEYPTSRLSPFKQPGNLATAGQGRLFFQSQDALSPGDHNGKIQDIYEWKPEGVGDCDRPFGCVALITSGNSKNDSFFLDSTPSGSDAFFITREQLLARDKDEMLDLYDARVGGGFNEAQPPPCLGEACKGPVPGTAAVQSPGSASFNGPANKKPRCHKPKKCHKQKKKQRKHKKQQHKRSAKNNRGGSK